PSTVSPGELTFDLAPIAGDAGLSDVSVTLAVLESGAASVMATAATAADLDPSNNASELAISVLDTPATAFLEVDDAPELGGGHPTGTGERTLIEGFLDGGEADLYRIRVDDWSTFSASTSDDPTLIAGCAGVPVDETALYLFDANGMGIAFNEDGGVGGRGS